MAYDDQMPFGVVPSYDPMTGALIGSDPGRTEPEAMPNRIARGIIQAIANMPKAAAIDAPAALIDSARMAPLPGAERTPEGDAAMQNLAGNSFMTALGLAGGGMPFSTAGAAGIFGGRLAKTADHAMLQKAEEMHAAGADRRAIWDQTGWFRGEDGKWRFEIPDNNAQMNPNVYSKGMPEDERLAKVAGEIWHPELYAAYPGLRNATAMIEKGPSPGSGAYYGPGVGEERVVVRAASPSSARSVALHELQHAVQEREGFASGGNPAMFSQGHDALLARQALAYREKLAQLDPKLSREEKDLALITPGVPFPKRAVRDMAHDAEGNPDEILRKVVELYGVDKRSSPYSPIELYRQIPGEVEARNVQARRDMTPEQRRAIFPWETADMQSSPAVSRMFGSRVGLLEGGQASKAAQMSIEDNPFGIRAYHGSPHDFDRFDLSKIGTGEGAQAYGHGLYFAGNEGVARSYRDALAPGNAMTLNGVRFDQLTPSQRRVAQWIENTGAHPEEIAKISMQRAEKARREASQFGLPGVDPDIFARAHADTAKAASDLAASGRWEVGRAPNGHMYEVNINADPRHFLDWDKPVSGQHPRVEQGVYDALLRSGLDKSVANHLINNGEGARIVRQMARPSWPIRDDVGSPWKAGGATREESLAMVGGDRGRIHTMLTPDPVYTSSTLREHGIPGVKYLDQGSRGKGDGSRNYVVFDDKLIDILRKYGLVGGAAPIGALAMGGSEERQ